MSKINRSVVLLFPLFLLIFLFPFSKVSASCVYGQNSCSSAYGISRYSFDSGGTLDNSCSGSYCAAQTLGDTAVGNSAGGSYQVQAGFNVNREPSLELFVNSANINTGVLSTTATATATATFYVKSYLSSGYVIDTISPPPRMGSYALLTPSIPTASSVGTEQFGINLVSNTIACGAPTNFGSNPVQVPSTVFSFGQATSNYDTCGKFMYKSGDSIASSSESSGQTDYTISYITNISSTTPGGVYTMYQQIVAIPTF